MPENPIKPSEARRLVLERVRPLEEEPIPLRSALGRVLAEDVESAEPVPGFDNSAMDGFAVRAADTAGRERRRPRSRCASSASRGRDARPIGARGRARRSRSRPGRCCPGRRLGRAGRGHAHARTAGSRSRSRSSPGTNVRRAGEDIEPGERVLRSGRRDRPGRAGRARLGRPRPRSLRAAARASRVLTTGDELLEPGEPLRPGGVRNSNAYSVPALARARGRRGRRRRDRSRDDLDATRAAIERRARRRRRRDLRRRLGRRARPRQARRSRSSASRRSSGASR